MPEPGFAIYVANGSSLWKGGDPPPDLSFPIPVAIAPRRDGAEQAVSFLARAAPQVNLVIDTLPCEASHTERRRIRHYLSAVHKGAFGEEIQRIALEADRLLAAIGDQPNPPHAQSVPGHHQPIIAPLFSGFDGGGCAASEYVDAEIRNTPDPIRGRPRLIDLLKKAVERLRLLTTVERHGADWFLAIGEAFERFPGICHGLGTIGFLTEARELIRARDQLLRAVGPILVSQLSEGAPKEASQLALIAGVSPDPSPDALDTASTSVVDLASEMADRIDRICEAVQATPVPIPDDFYPTNADGTSGTSSSPPRSPSPFRIDPFAIAGRAWQIGNRIRKLPHQIGHLLDANPWLGIHQAREQLNPIAIAVDFLPVANYIERHWTLEHSRKIIGQLHKVTDSVEEFLKVYESMTTTHSRDTFMWKREEEARFLPFCLMIAQEIAQWAAEIEDRAKREERIKRPPGGDDRSPQQPVKQWEPPPGYVGTKDICYEARFAKRGKNPRPSTIQRWVERDEREANQDGRDPVKIIPAPDTHENHYPEAWILAQIARWNPRRSA